MATLTPEQRQEIERAGEEPLRIEDPETHEIYFVIREEVYRRLTEPMEHSDESLYEFEDFQPL